MSNGRRMEWNGMKWMDGMDQECHRINRVEKA